MSKLTKQEKIDIVNEALEVLYRELNDYSVHSDFPIQEVPHIAESILRLESLLDLLNIEPIKLPNFEYDFTEEKNDEKL